MYKKILTILINILFNRGGLFAKATSLEIAFLALSSVVLFVAMVASIYYAISSSKEVKEEQKKKEEEEKKEKEKDGEIFKDKQKDKENINEEKNNNKYLLGKKLNKDNHISLPDDGNDLVTNPESKLISNSSSIGQFQQETLSEKFNSLISDISKDDSKDEERKQKTKEKINRIRPKTQPIQSLDQIQISEEPKNEYVENPTEAVNSYQINYPHIPSNKQSKIDEAQQNVAPIEADYADMEKQDQHKIDDLIEEDFAIDNDLKEVVTDINKVNDVSKLKNEIKQVIDNANDDLEKVREPKYNNWKTIVDRFNIVGFDDENYKNDKQNLEQKVEGYKAASNVSRTYFNDKSIETDETFELDKLNEIKTNVNDKNNDYSADLNAKEQDIENSIDDFRLKNKQAMEVIETKQKIEDLKNKLEQNKQENKDIIDTCGKHRTKEKIDNLLSVNTPPSDCPERSKYYKPYLDKVENEKNLANSNISKINDLINNQLQEVKNLNKYPYNDPDNDKNTIDQKLQEIEDGLNNLSDTFDVDVLNNIENSCAQVYEDAIKANKKQDDLNEEIRQFKEKCNNEKNKVNDIYDINYKIPDYDQKYKDYVDNGYITQQMLDDAKSSCLATDQKLKDKKKALEDLLGTDIPNLAPNETAHDWCLDNDENNNTLDNIQQNISDYNDKINQDKTQLDNAKNELNKTIKTNDVNNDYEGQEYKEFIDAGEEAKKKREEAFEKIDLIKSIIEYNKNNKKFCNDYNEFVQQFNNLALDCQKLKSYKKYDNPGVDYSTGILYENESYKTVIKNLQYSVLHEEKDLNSNLNGVDIENNNDRVITIEDADKMTTDIALILPSTNDDTVNDSQISNIKKEIDDQIKKNYEILEKQTSKPISKYLDKIEDFVDEMEEYRKSIKDINTDIQNNNFVENNLLSYTTDQLKALNQQLENIKTKCENAKTKQKDLADKSDELKQLFDKAKDEQKRIKKKKEVLDKAKQIADEINAIRDKIKGTEDAFKDIDGIGKECKYPTVPVSFTSAFKTKYAIKDKNNDLCSSGYGLLKDYNDSIDAVKKDKQAVNDTIKVDGIGLLYKALKVTTGKINKNQLKLDDNVTETELNNIDKALDDLRDKYKDTNIEEKIKKLDGYKKIPNDTLKAFKEAAETYKKLATINDFYDAHKGATDKTYNKVLEEIRKQYPLAGGVNTNVAEENNGTYTEDRYKELFEDDIEYVTDKEDVEFYDKSGNPIPDIKYTGSVLKQSDGKLVACEYGVVKNKNSDEIIYKGMIGEGKPNGKGIYYYDDGSRYEGFFEGGEREGFGRMYNKDGMLKYEGGFNTNDRNGNGIQYFDNGDRFYGYFNSDFDNRSIDDKKFGSNSEGGILITPNGYARLVRFVCNSATCYKNYINIINGDVNHEEGKNYANFNGKSYLDKNYKRALLFHKSKDGAETIYLGYYKKDASSGEFKCLGRGLLINDNLTIKYAKFKDGKYSKNEYQNMFYNNGLNYSGQVTQQEPIDSSGNFNLSVKD